MIYATDGVVLMVSKFGEFAEKQVMEVVQTWVLHGAYRIKRLPEKILG